MTPFRILTASLAAFCIIGPTCASAQEMTEDRREWLMTQDNSRFSAPVTILQNHPQCNGPGEVAFATEIEAPDMDLRIHGEGWRGGFKQFNFYGEAEAGQTCLARKNQSQTPNKDRCAAIPADELVMLEEAQDCFVTERKGSEVITRQIACVVPPAPNRSVNDLILDADIRLDATASAQLCQSLTGIALLQSAWKATFSIGGITETIEGEFGPDKLPSAVGDRTFQAYLSLNRKGHRMQTASPIVADGPFQLDPMRSGAFSLLVEVESFKIPGLPQMPATLRAQRGFRLDID